MDNQTNGHVKEVELVEDEQDLEPQPSAPQANQSKPARSNSWAALAVLAGVIALPILWRSQPQPVPQVVAQTQPQSNTSAPNLPPIPPPSDDDLKVSLDASVKALQESFDTFVYARADRYSDAAQKSDNANLRQLKLCLAVINKLQALSYKQGVFDGSAETANQNREALAESLACMVAARRLQVGEAKTNVAVKPQTAIDKARQALSIYAAKQGLNLNDPQLTQDTAQAPQSSSQPPVRSDSGNPAQ